MDVEPELVELGQLTLAELPDLEPQVIALAMQRLLRRLADPESITSGYNPQRLD